MLDKLITILSERGLQPRPHQLRNILDYTDPKLPHVAACATAAGKTVMTAGKLELYYQCGIIKPHEKVLIIPSDKTILRGNFLEQFDKFFSNVKSSFTYVGVEDKKQLKKSIDSNVQVIIGLPQLIKDHTNLFKDVSWLIVDEAHKWYFAPTITNIIREVKPKHQFLLTGTPYKFNLHKNNFIIDYTTVRSLYQDGYICDVNFQVLHSSLPLTRLDYKDLLDNVRQDKRFGKEELEYAFNDVINELVNKLKLPNKNLSTVHNISKNIFNVFGKLEKTIIFTHGIPEANCISEYLKINGVNVITSHSKIDGEIAEDTFNEFRDDKDIKVLISVNRGKEGFDFPELYNIIDMTYSQNFEVVQQMMGRLMRPSLDGHEKVFYKVAPRNTSGYFSDWMDCLIQLFDDYWYSKFNGRNTMDIRVPNNLINRRNVEETVSEVKLEDGTEIQVTNENVTTGTKVTVVSETGEVQPVQDGTHTLLDGIVIETKDGVVISNNRQSAPVRPIRPKNLTTMGFDNSLSFMEKNDYFKLDDPLSTVATTSLKKIVYQFDGTMSNRYKKDELFLSFNDSKKYVKTIDKKWRTSLMWSKYCISGEKPDYIPSSPYKVYDEWVDWADWLGTDYLPLDEVKKIVHPLNLQSEKEWLEYCGSGNKPDNIPSNYRIVYGNITTGEFLGHGRIADNLREFKTLNELKKLAKNLGIGNRNEWDNYWKINERPLDVPANPASTHKDEWKSWPDFCDKEVVIYWPFKKAKKFVCNLKLGNTIEYRKYCKSNLKPKELHNSPDYYYGKLSEWTNWPDFLGNNVKPKQFKGRKKKSH
jgi:superfamily II DNA or RNA helicase